MTDFTHENLSGARFEDVYLTGAYFHGVDLTGARFRLVDMTGVTIRGADLVDMEISGQIESLRINGVDVAPLVEAELDRRYPGRAKMRPSDAAGYREAWDVLEPLWQQTVARARDLDPELLHQRVDGEWSFVETLRHLVFATDRWAGYMILDKPVPYHPLGLPQPGYTTPADAAALGIDLGARPHLAEVVEARGIRMTMVRGIVDGLTDDDLGRECPRLPAPEYPEETRSVGLCLGVVMREECEHRRYAVRDLVVLGS